MSWVNPAAVAWGVTLEGRKVLLGLALGSRESYEERMTACRAPLLAKALCRMVTANPAEALGWKTASAPRSRPLDGDVLVTSDRVRDAYRNLIEATERDGMFVAINGEPFYGVSKLRGQTKAENADVIPRPAHRPRLPGDRGRRHDVAAGARHARGNGERSGGLRPEASRRAAPPASPTALQALGRAKDQAAAPRLDPAARL
ncbi:MAG: hypothetical protein M3198_10575 [Actinomycetota bacterium]|nr:hypothetical protein [Actinomycetota bacterium]